MLLSFSLLILPLISWLSLLLWRSVALAADGNRGLKETFTSSEMGKNVYFVDSGQVQQTADYLSTLPEQQEIRGQYKRKYHCLNTVAQGLSRHILLTMCQYFCTCGCNSIKQTTAESRWALLTPVLKRNHCILNCTVRCWRMWDSRQCRVSFGTAYWNLLRSYIF